MKSKIKNLLEDLRQDNTSGARELTKRSLNIIQTYLTPISNEEKDITSEMKKLASKIIDSRPSMAPLINTMGYLVGDMNIITKKLILKRLKQFSEYREEQMNSLEGHFRTLFDRLYKPDIKIMLISHSSTVNAVLSNYKEKAITFYVLESRPLLEGQRTAEYFSKDFQTNLIADSAMGKFIEEIDVVLVGIDSILRDGSIVNKIGTYPLAVLALENNKRVYAVGDSFKYNLRSHFGQKINIEQKPSAEIYEGANKNENLSVKNYYFDKTPPQYITGIISDLGIHTPLNFLEEVKKSLNIEWFNAFIEK
jgi:translation initiation factor 2B subunit (eIF-2B alpha/beta/delta family)